MCVNIYSVGAPELILILNQNFLTPFSPIQHKPRQMQSQNIINTPVYNNNTTIDADQQVSIPRRLNRHIIS